MYATCIPGSNVTAVQHLNKMLDTLQSCADKDEMITMEKICRHQALEERYMALEHEREMAKIRLAESRLRFQQDKLRVEAAAYGQPQNGGGDDNDNNDNKMRDNFEDIPNEDDM